VLAGGRWYEVTKDLTYFNEKPGGLQIPAFGTGPIPARSLTDDGFVPKIGLQYDISDDVMIYGVYSEGYRVGGVNRGKAAFPTLPNEYESDTIENRELGLKATWLDGRLQVNATLYEMKWKDVQIEITDPSNTIERPENDTVCLLDAEGEYVLDRCKNQPFQDAAANIGDATVRGADIDVKALLGDSVQVGFNITKLDEAYVDGPDGYADDRFAGGQANLGLGPNTPLPLFADVSYSLYVEYSAKVDLLGDGDFTARVQHSHNGDSLNQLSSSDNSPRQTQGDFSVTDVVFGYGTDDWNAQLSLNNITDERGITYKDSADFDPYYGRNSDNVIRPRNMKFSIRRFF
jgi:outer membrane receptor protein involved in Fe transport